MTLLASPDTGALAVPARAAAAMDPKEVLQMLGSGPDGLPGREAGTRLARLGPNALAVESRSLLAIVLEQVRNAGRQGQQRPEGPWATWKGPELRSGPFFLPAQAGKGGRASSRALNAGS